MPLCFAVPFRFAALLAPLALVCALGPVAARAGDANGTAGVVGAGGSGAGDNNKLVIRQIGADNRLTTVQSGSNSAIGGLVLSAAPGAAPQPLAQQIAGALLPLSQPPVTAGDLLDAVAGLAVIGTGARSGDTLVVRADRAGAAQQLGDNNRATVTINGDNGYVGLLQDSRGSRLGNTATVSLTGSGEALLGQIGCDNVANLLVGQGALGGAIVQKGANNAASLAVTGAGARGAITQVGNNNHQALTVSGAGTAASYTVVGSNTASALPGGVVVSSNGASVQITQTMLGGF